jgi:hypothetical protein
MMQPSAGSQPSTQQPAQQQATPQQVSPDQQQKTKPGKQFLSKYVNNGGYLSNLVATSIQNLQTGRIPSNFSQVADGQVGQDLKSNQQNYV